MKVFYNEERNIKMCEPDCVDEYLFNIWAIGCDYQGCNTVESLKKLVDELIRMASDARMCLWDNKLFGVYGSPNSKVNQ